MPPNLDNRKFRSLANTDNGDVSSQTIFHYRQRGDVVWAEYRGGSVRQGSLIARWTDGDTLEMRYHHITRDNQIKTGRCTSHPEMSENGRLLMYEEWQWTTGDKSSGISVIEEI